MPPKNKASPSKGPKAKSMEEIQEEMLEKINLLTEKLSSLESALLEAVSNNNKLKATVASQADEICHLKDCLNEREQYARSWSVRVLNIPLPAGQESNTRVVMDTVYQRLLLPILEGARKEREINSIPSCESLLENAHILPGKGSNKPIIVRFFSRYWRSLIFKHRRNYAPREETTHSSSTRRGAEGDERRGRLAYSFFEDLSKPTFRQLQAIKASKDVTSAWTVSGSIRFKIKDNENIFKVSSLLDTVENLTS